MEKQAQEVLRRLEMSSDVVADVETSGLDWKHNYIVGHVFNFGPKDEDSFYIPVRHQGGNYMNFPPPSDTATSDTVPLHPFENKINAVLRTKKVARLSSLATISTSIYVSCIVLGWY